MKQIKRVLKILAAGLLLGILAICLVYLLPCGSLQKHASESLKILKTEGENPFLLEGYKGSSLDNYTDTLMITQAVYQSEEPFYKAAMLSERKSNGKDQPIVSGKFTKRRGGFLFQILAWLSGCFKAAAGSDGLWENQNAESGSISSDTGVTIDRIFETKAVAWIGCIYHSFVQYVSYGNSEVTAIFLHVLCGKHCDTGAFIRL